MRDHPLLLSSHRGSPSPHEAATVEVGVPPADNYDPRLSYMTIGQLDAKLSR
jgi:hypothetical protein